MGRERQSLTQFLRKREKWKKIFFNASGSEEKKNIERGEKIVPSKLISNVSKVFKKSLGINIFTQNGCQGHSKSNNNLGQRCPTLFLRSPH